MIATDTMQHWQRNYRLKNAKRKSSKKEDDD